MALYLASGLNYPNFTVSTGGSNAPTGPAGGALTGTYPNPGLAALVPSPAGTYGDGNNVPQLTVSSTGQVTTVTNVGINFNGLFFPFESQAAGAGDINLTSANKFFQLITGSAVSQIVRLPDVATLSLGRTFHIQNTNPGLLLFRTNSDAQIGVVGPFGYADFTCVSIVDNSLSGWDSHIVNDRQTIQLGEGAVAFVGGSSAIGRSATAGLNASAFGQQALAQGPGSCAFGVSSNATNAAVDGMAFGNSANASGNAGSIAFGANANCASDSGAAFGYFAQSDGGNNGCAFGGHSRTRAAQATALGAFTDARLPNSLALGSGAVVSDPRFLLSINLGGAGVENWNNGQAIGASVNGIAGYIPFLQDPVPSKLSFSAQRIAQAGGTTNFTGVEPTVTVFTGAGGQTVNLFGFATPIVDIGIMYRFYNKGSGNVTIRAADSANIVILGPNNGVELVAIDYVDTPAGWFVSAL